MTLYSLIAVALLLIPIILGVRGEPVQYDDHEFDYDYDHYRGDEDD